MAINQTTITNAEKKLDEYEKMLEDLVDEHVPNMEIDGKALKQVLKDQLVLEVEFELITKKCKRVFAEFEQLSAEARTDAMNEILSNSYASRSITEAKEIALKDETYRRTKRIEVRAKSIYDEALGMQDVVHSRRYILNNITNATVASVKETLL